MNSMWFTDDAYVDFDRVRIVFKNGEIKEIRGSNGFKLLAFLSENAGRHFSKDDMINSIWSDDFGYTPNNLHQALKDIRNWLNNRGIPQYYRGSNDYVFTAPPQKAPPKVPIDESAGSSVSTSPESLVGDRTIQEQLIYSINTTIEMMYKQMMSAIGDKNGGAYESKIGKYIYSLGLDKSISVYEGMMDLLKTEDLSNEENKLVGKIYMRIAGLYRAMGLVKKDSDLNRNAWQVMHLAADFGDPVAMQNIAIAFYNGNMGISKSENDARIWYKKAIAAGCKPAEFQFSKYFPGESAT